jgi:predicted ATPase/class 3 adenylate cyclase
MTDPLPSLPSGTVTFLFTDIEGSTLLSQLQPEEMKHALARHHAILRAAIESNGGHVFQIVGDSFSAAFEDALNALNAALDAQRRLRDQPWGEMKPIQVRMGLHTGVVKITQGSMEMPYSGYSTLAFTQRIMSAAYGEQILLSGVTRELLEGLLPPEVTLRDMGKHRLKDLLHPIHMYQVTTADLPTDFPPLKALDLLPHNLPVQLTSFIGREREKTEIKAMLNSARLITLTGSGGTGKTRLAIEVGTEELTSFANGVWLIEFAPLSDPSQMIPAIAQVFGLREHPFASLNRVVMDYLRDKKCLLILDNCEHLIEACARLADDVLHQCVGLKILATSREALGVTGEMIYHTPSLGDSESVHLFVERARAVNSNFRLTEGDASSVTQICQRLDGIPLGIELAAARVKVLSPEQIASRLDDRFRLLVGGSRTALPRQQTLRALIDWSYDLLSEEEKRLLQFASVFVGGWTLEALEAVAGDPDTIEHLEQLVNKSLVVTEEHGNEMRYFMLETIRQYAREKLFEAKQSSAARDWHFVYFDTLSEEMLEASRSSDMLPWRDRAEDEAENFRAAVEWGLENHVEDTLRLAANFCLISDLISRLSEGMTLVQSAITRAKALPPVSGTADIHRQKLIASALLSQAIGGMSQGNLPFAMESLHEAIAISRATGDKFILGNSLILYTAVSSFINAPGGSEAAQEALTIFTDEITDPWGLSMAYLSMARIASAKGDLSEKQKYIGKLKELIGEASLSYQAGMLFLIMGMDESVYGNYESAKQFFEDALHVFTRLKYKHFQLATRSEMGHIARHTGDLQQASQIYSETIMGWKDLGNRGAIAHELECFAFIAIAEEELPRTLKLFGAAEALREKAHSPMTDHERIEYDQAVARVRALLNESEFNSLWAEGRTLPMEQAIEYALSGMAE